MRSDYRRVCETLWQTLKMSWRLRFSSIQLYSQNQVPRSETTAKSIERLRVFCFLNLENIYFTSFHIPSLYFLLRLVFLLTIQHWVANINSILNRQFDLEWARQSRHSWDPESSEFFVHLFDWAYMLIDDLQLFDRLHNNLNVRSR